MPWPVTTTFLLFNLKLPADAVKIIFANFSAILSLRSTCLWVYQRATRLPKRRQYQPARTRYSGFMWTRTALYDELKVQKAKVKIWVSLLVPRSLPKLFTITFAGKLCAPSCKQITVTCSQYLANSAIQE